MLIIIVKRWGGFYDSLRLDIASDRREIDFFKFATLFRTANGYLSFDKVF